jgi:hypothetical protein
MTSATEQVAIALKMLMTIYPVSTCQFLPVKLTFYGTAFKVNSKCNIEAT